MSVAHFLQDELLQPTASENLSIIKSSPDGAAKVTVCMCVWVCMCAYVCTCVCVCVCVCPGQSPTLPHSGDEM